MEIKLCKGAAIGNKAYAIGVKNANWIPAEIVIRFSADNSKATYWSTVTINDGVVMNGSVAIGVTDKEGNPVKAEDIVREIYKQNSATLVVSAVAGAHRKAHYGLTNKWYIDYSPEVESLLQELGVMPSDRISYKDRVKASVMVALGETADGRKAIDEARKKLEAEKKALEEEIKAAEAKNKALEAENAKLKKKEVVGANT